MHSLKDMPKITLTSPSILDVVVIMDWNYSYSLQCKTQIILNAEHLP